MNKISIISSVIFILILVGIIVCNSNIHNEENIKARQFCDEYSIVEISETKEISREEFLEGVLKVIGVTEPVINHYRNIDTSMPTDDFGEYGQYTPNRSNIDEVRRYMAILLIAKDVGNLQIYNDKNHELNFFHGKNNISYKEAIVMAQAVLQENEERMFSNKSETFDELYKKSKNNITKFYDLKYWIPVDYQLNRNDAYVLLYRLAQQKRYKYADKNSSPTKTFGAIQTEMYQNTTYLNHLQVY